MLPISSQDLAAAFGLYSKAKQKKHELMSEFPIIYQQLLRNRLPTLDAFHESLREDCHRESAILKLRYISMYIFILHTNFIHLTITNTDYAIRKFELECKAIGTDVCKCCGLSSVTRGILVELTKIQSSSAKIHLYTVFTQWFIKVVFPVLYKYRSC